MRYLLDTGVLLRLLNREAEQHANVRAAVRTLKQQQHECVACLQNLCEFWNVCTRPESARGGLGLTFDEAYRRLRTIERIVAIIPDSPATLARWKELIVTHKVQGVQVHDTRLVAWMDTQGISHLLTLNPADFRRFAHLTVVTPDMILSR